MHDKSKGYDGFANRKTSTGNENAVPAGPRNGAKDVANQQISTKDQYLNVLGNAIPIAGAIGEPSSAALRRLIDLPCDESIPFHHKSRAIQIAGITGAPIQDDETPHEFIRRIDTRFPGALDLSSKGFIAFANGLLKSSPFMEGEGS
jgi:hypothetical protein